MAQPTWYPFQKLARLVFQILEFGKALFLFFYFQLSFIYNVLTFCSLISNCLSFLYFSWCIPLPHILKFKIRFILPTRTLKFLLYIFWRSIKKSILFYFILLEIFKFQKYIFNHFEKHNVCIEWNLIEFVTKAKITDP